MPKKKEKPLVTPVTPLDESAQAIADLTNLLQTRGWRVVKKILEFNVKHYEDKILDTENATSEDKENWIKYRKVYKFVSILPEELIQDMKENKPIPIILDPYAD